MAVNILGISAYYHDSAAALVRDGIIVAACQEERFTRKKHDAVFPAHAITSCLAQAGIRLRDLDHIVFYDKPLIKFERLLETYLSYAPRGLRSFIAAMPVWLKDKLFLKTTLRRELAALGNMRTTELPPLLFTAHHESHAASAFYPSPFTEAAVLCLDGVGEWATSSVWHGRENRLKPLWEIDFPHSLGLLYSAFTYYTGFKVNSGEYKLMGLAPYGEPKYVDLILDNLLDLKEDGTFHLDMSYFNYATGLTMTGGKFHKLFGGPPRRPESGLTRKEMDIARSIQMVAEEIILRLARTIKREQQVDNLCLAGGVALNCVANGRIVRECDFNNIWIQPAAGDAGGALGAALAIWHQYLDQPRIADGSGDSMRGSYLGPGFSNEEIKDYLESAGAVFTCHKDSQLLPELAALIAQGNVVGWFNGRMEFGPRALGGRSIIGDPRNTGMQSQMNLKIKYRESFRPFAPAVKADKVGDWFAIDRESPYMLLVAPVQPDKRIESDDGADLFGLDKLRIPRSRIPAVTHVDYSARLQTIHRQTNPRFYRLADEFDKITGCPVLINTSFNVRGEPIVCTPEDAYRCFMRTEMDYLVMENILLAKNDQPKIERDDSWQREFALD
ncbi:MAG: carbamoyltransferase [Desulfobulbaceae bacterium]|nr:carbamoyltransferase [Desulfobulbaceae bacterium]